MKQAVSLRILLTPFVLASLVVAWPGAGEAAADDGTQAWVLRVSPTWIDSNRGDEFVIGHRGGVVSGLPGRGVGLGVAGEYRLSPRLGLEVGVLAASNGVGSWVRDGVVVGGGTSSYGSLTLGPDIHVAPRQRADLYFGPFLAYTARTDVGWYQDDFAGVRVGGSFGWGAVVGADVPVGARGWRVCASLRYIDTRLDGTDRNGDHFDLDYNPTAIGVGVGYRF